MSARRLFRAVMRPIKRLARSLRLRHIDYLVAHSRAEVTRLRRHKVISAKDRMHLIRVEWDYQGRLIARRDKIARGQ